MYTVKSILYCIFGPVISIGQIYFVVTLRGVSNQKSSLLVIYFMTKRANFPNISKPPAAVMSDLLWWVRYWSEGGPGGPKDPFYSIERVGGVSWNDLVVRPQITNSGRLLLI